MAAEPPLVGLFGGLEPEPATRTHPVGPGPTASGTASDRVAGPISDPLAVSEAPSAALPWEAPAVEGSGPASTSAVPIPATPASPPAAARPRPPAPTAHEAAQRRWDALVADIAKGLPLGSGPAGGALPSIPIRPEPGVTPVPPWLASNAHLVAATAQATLPDATPTDATGTRLQPRASVMPASAEWPASVPPPPITPPAPWEPPVTTTYPYPITADEPSPTEPIRWRHPAAGDPVPVSPEADPAEVTRSRRPRPFSLLPVTLTNRLRRQLGTRGPRTDLVTPPEIGSATSAAASASLTGTSSRSTVSIATSRPSGHGLVEAPPVQGTIVSLGDQFRRAEQLRAERASLDGQRLRGDSGGEPPG